jgi:hypothetical protein
MVVQHPLKNVNGYIRNRLTRWQHASRGNTAGDWWHIALKGGKGGVHRGFIGDIAMGEKGPAAKALANHLCGILVDVDQSNGGALIMCGTADGCPDATTATGDND